MGFVATLALILAVQLVVVFWLRRLIIRRLSPERILRDLREDVAELTREINRVGDQHITLVEDRISSLKSLMVHAENLIDEVRTVLGRLESYRSPAEATAAGNETSVAAASVDTDSADDVPADPTAPIPDESPRRSVERLHRQGLSPEIIAARLGIAIGEVELMISLMEQRTR